MKRILIVTLLAGAALTLAACTENNMKSPDVAGSIRKSLDDAGYKDVTTSQDRDKGVVTLGGHVADEGAKRQAEAIALQHAAGQVVANQIAVIPPGNEKDAKAIISDLDGGIEKNVDALLIANKLKDNVKYSVKSQVVTLTGNVDSQQRRADVEAMAAAVPNVRQVVNELQVKEQKATSTR